MTKRKNGKSGAAVRSSERVMRRERRVTHKTCPTWGVTQCMKTLWPIKIDAPKTTERWRDVTCKLCLKDKP